MCVYIYVRKIQYNQLYIYTQNNLIGIMTFFKQHIAYLVKTTTCI